MGMHLRRSHSSIGTQLVCLEWLSHHTFFHLKFLPLVGPAFQDGSDGMLALIKYLFFEVC